MRLAGDHVLITAETAPVGAASKLGEHAERGDEAVGLADREPAAPILLDEVTPRGDPGRQEFRERVGVPIDLRRLEQPALQHRPPRSGGSP